MRLVQTLWAPPTCLIVGLGNSLLQDDGIGVHAVSQLAKDPPPGAQILEVGTDVFTAIPWLESVPWVLAIDAMDAGGPPGTTYQCDVSQVAGPARPVSLHQLGLTAVLEFIPLARRPEITVLGVQPAVVEYGLDLSPVLAGTLPRVIEAARSMVAVRAIQQERRVSDSGVCLPPVLHDKFFDLVPRCRHVAQTARRTRFIREAFRPVLIGC